MIALGDFLNLLRKNQHIELCQNAEVESQDRYTGFENICLRVESLPAKNFSDISLETEAFDRSFQAPYFITGMTGGTSQGTELNLRLAKLASKKNIAIGVGSQRIAIEKPELASIFQLKNRYPNIFLIGNLGISHISGKSGVDKVRSCIDMIEADALAIHINILQELVQPEGDKNFASVYDDLARLRDKFHIPIVIKEVGAGLDIETISKLVRLGFKHFDIGGKGGTSWARIEGQRSQSEEDIQVGETFRDFGIPTAYALYLARCAFPDLYISATGGFRSGRDAAKALALKANMIGIGLPFFRAACESYEALERCYKRLEKELKIAIMLSGVQSPAGLPEALRLEKRPMEVSFIEELRRRGYEYKRYGK